MQLKAKINKLWANITGHASQFPLETRIFHSLCVIATIALGYNVPFNYLIGLQVVSLMSFVAMLFFMLLYYRSRYHGKVNSSLVIFALTGNILFVFNYIYNSGTNGPTDLLMGLCIMLVLCVAPKRQQRFWVALNLLILIGLHALEYYLPNVIPDTYVSRRARYIDVTSAYVVFVFVLYYTIAYLRRNYDFEKNSAANKAIAIERQNAEMTHVNHELARINTERNKLLFIIAHDLRSPLGNIQNYLELVNDNELDSDDRRSVESDLLNVTRGTIEMLGKMLMWSKAQMDGVNVKLGYINLSDALYNTVELEKSLAAKKSITFNVDLDWGARIVADSDMLQLVIRNLLNNAIKFTPNGGIISFKAKQIGAECWLIIRDNGVGIPESMHAGLFSFQGSPTLGTENEKGVGLGLVLCKEFTELQGGRIWLECPEEGGTVFYVSMPAAT
ncbi:HAMP domain-containing histidine kinase [Mucilaginibacter pallidiroseus]|uniref:histidine kinase n=1 Tax=Mucilaginibacter pallidiroseus TaxID=2599295 RepID=A0A563U340_9SPHI|nr:HAMP domain-containing sensor histidine kinase [Mucilaginibacter pallidiroseus]TWR25743.1 HAMP domain-containing histidine kinase [Mucilaginibacter pallidiroseus]